MTSPEDPRVRGDDWQERETAEREAGGPSRARGRPGPRTTPPLRPGRTPACAGTTPHGPLCSAQPREDPRVRGDDFLLRDESTTNTGGPPRARGRLPQRQADRLLVGRTPACAGTTTAELRLVTTIKEDPRVRGDDWRYANNETPDEGGPPRARGRLPGVSLDAGMERRTPACAGTTCARSPASPHPGEDPRVRGDDDPDAKAPKWEAGGPPRARGRRAVCRRRQREQGRTPACAGTTTAATRWRRGRREDPRVRGDDAQPVAHLHLGVGRTPACAGTTPRGWACRRPPAEDPRVRGDDTQNHDDHVHAQGGPPRARGRPPAPPADRGADGRTPACAGTTRPRSLDIWRETEDPRVRGDDSPAPEPPDGA